MAETVEQSTVKDTHRDLVVYRCSGEFTRNDIADGVVFVGPDHPHPRTKIVEPHFLTKTEIIMNKMFELEQKILGCWNVTDDLRHLLDKWEDESAEREQIRTICKYYTYKFDDMWTTFEEVFSEMSRLRKYIPEQPQL